MSNHIKSQIGEYLAGRLPESARREFEAHAAGCEACRRAVIKERGKQARHKREALKKASVFIPNLLYNRLAKQGNEPPGPGGFPWIPVLLLAAAVAIVYFFWSHRPTRKPDTHSVPPSGAPQHVVPSSATLPVPEAVPENVSEAPFAAEPVASTATAPVRRRRRPTVEVSSATLPATPAAPASMLPAAPAAVNLSTSGPSREPLHQP